MSLGTGLSNGFIAAAIRLVRPLLRPLPYAVLLHLVIDQVVFCFAFLFTDPAFEPVRLRCLYVDVEDVRPEVARRRVVPFANDAAVVRERVFFRLVQEVLREAHHVLRELLGEAGDFAAAERRDVLWRRRFLEGVLVDDEVVGRFRFRCRQLARLPRQLHIRIRVDFQRLQRRIVRLLWLFTRLVTLCAELPLKRPGILDVRQPLHFKRRGGF